MQDPCNPTPHHAASVIHHHPPGQVIGRIRRHGTHRIARRLHAASGTCPAGPPIVVGSTTLKAMAPAMSFVGLTTIASELSAPTETGASVADFAPGAVGVAPHKHSHPDHPQVSVPEPPSLSLLLLVTVGWMGIRLGFRRFRPPRVLA